MSRSVALSGCFENCMLASSAIFRRQLFLIRSLGGHCCRVHMERMQRGEGARAATLEADAEGIIRKITPVMDPRLCKGQAGLFLLCFLII